MLHRVIGLSSLALTVALPLQAQEFSGRLTFGLSETSVDDFDGSLRSMGIDGLLGVNFGNGLTMDADLRLGRTDSEGEDLSTTGIGLAARYQFQNGTTLGAYAERDGISFDGDDLTLTSVGVLLGYSAGPVRVEAYVGQTDLGDTDVTSDDIGLYLSYATGQGLALGGGIAKSDVDGDDLTMFRLGAVQDLNTDWTMFGGLEMADEAGIDYSSLGIGISRDVSSVLGMPSSVSVEYLRQTISDGTDDVGLNTLRLGMTLPFGKDASQLPVNSLTQKVLRPRHNALPATITSGLVF